MARYLIWYWSATGGGGSQFAVNLAHRLSRQFGNEAVRLSLHANDPTLARARTYEFETLAADVTTDRRRPLATIAALMGSADVLRDHARGADVVIVPMNFAAAAPLSAFVRQPLVYVAHDPAPHPGDYARTWQRATQAVLLQRCARLVAMSRFAQAELERQGVGGKCVHAPLSSVFEPVVSTPVTASGPVQFLCAGRMMAYKGLDILADALPKLRLRPDWRLIIAGDGPALGSNMRARLDADERIDLRPQWMSEDTLTALIAACDVLLAPYHSATQSGVVAQALAAGKPCVVTPVGALAEQIGDGEAGWVAQAANAPAFATAMTAALDEDARQHRGAAAIALAQAEWRADHWSWLSSL